MNKWRILTCSAIVALTVHPATAAESDVKGETTDAVNAFCDCAGFYKAGAILAKSAGQPGTQEKMQGLARGAEFAAQYLLATEYALHHSQPKSYGSFSAYTEGRVETSLAAVLSLMEGANKKEFDAQLAKCASLQQVQEEIVQKMRDNSVGR